MLYTCKKICLCHPVQPMDNKVINYEITARIHLRQFMHRDYLFLSFSHLLVYFLANLKSLVNLHDRTQNGLAAHGYENRGWFFSTVLYLFYNTIKLDGVVKSLHLLCYSVWLYVRHTTCMPSRITKHYALYMKIFT